MKNNDLRPAFICEDGKDIELTGWNIPATSGAQAIIRLENVQGTQISKMTVQGTAASFVRVEGTNSRNVEISNNKIHGIKKKIELVNK